MTQRPWLRALGPALLLSVGGAYALASLDWCPHPDTSARLTGSRAESGPLLAGAARIDIAPPTPIVVAGYGPLRPTTSRWKLPLRARALVLAMGKLRVGIVSLDLLSAPAELTSAIRARASGFDAVIVASTHVHSSMGAYDRRLFSELAGTGSFRPEAELAIVDAASRALVEATKALVPASVRRGVIDVPDLVASRDDTPDADPRLERWRFEAGNRPIAEVIVFAAHATLFPRGERWLSPDYPGALSAMREAAGDGVTLLLQGAVGNATTNLDHLHTPLSAEPWNDFASALSAAIDRATLMPFDLHRLALRSVSVGLPHSDARRLVPRIFRAVGDNFICLAAPRSAEVDALRLGEQTWMFFPAELTFGAAKRLESPNVRALSLANGYLGYVEIPERVANVTGESRRQYFDGSLVPTLERAANVALAGLELD